MSRLHPSSLALLPFFVAACGGTAVVESGAGGAGGAGATTNASTNAATSGTGTSSGVTGSTGSGVSCESLSKAYFGALAAAQECNACVDFDPCIGGPTFPDQCGCPVPVNGQANDLIDEVKNLEAQWTNAGCGPFECGQPCAISPSAFCTPNGGTDCTGTCSY